jgi:deoxyribodipyrimidine photo-lyase
MVGEQSKVHPDRVRRIRDGAIGTGPVVYWMSRDQRIDDNWAFLFAQDLALRRELPLAVVFCLAPKFLDAGLRQYDFMLRGLTETAERSRELNVAFTVLEGEPDSVLPSYLEETLSAACLVADFDPLRIKRGWLERVAGRLSVPFLEVDAHNVVPCWTASGKQEYAARTFRPKLRKHLAQFLEPFPQPQIHPRAPRSGIREPDWAKLQAGIAPARDVQPVHWIVPGAAAARSALASFLEDRLPGYAGGSRDPNANASSGLSPYLHFGQISAQRVALELLHRPAGSSNQESREAFWEQCIVRRELAENFCLYNRDYDRFQGLPEWARRTLDEHRKDPRPAEYSFEQFRRAETHDPLWNAAQREMVLQGKMHGYMRMYWAKKILEWSRSPEEAIATAVALNDSYELDGRDPGGYAGILWSVGGLHDQPFRERKVFGKIRYMSSSGCRRKFDVPRYIARWG